MSNTRNGILFSDSGELTVNGVAAGGVPYTTTAVPLKGDTHFPIFGKYTDASGAVYVIFR